MLPVFERLRSLRPTILIAVLLVLVSALIASRDGYQLPQPAAIRWNWRDRWTFETREGGATSLPGQRPTYSSRTIRIGPVILILKERP
jgi:hypothetical protein